MIYKLMTSIVYRLRNINRQVPLSSVLQPFVEINRFTLALEVQTIMLSTIVQSFREIELRDCISGVGCRQGVVSKFPIVMRLGEAALIVRQRRSDWGRFLQTRA